MKKLIKAAIVLLTTPFLGISQNGLPSVESVYSTIKSNPKVYESLKNDYKISNPKSCKIEMKMTIGSGDIVSDWSTYKSDEGIRLNYYWPEDRAYTVFTVTTPESSEGVTYSLPLVVEYSRIKNRSLQSNWEYYWWYFDTPYSSKGSKEDPLFYDLLINKLAELEGNVVPNRREEIPTAIEDFTRILKIEKTTEPDIRNNYSNADEVTRVYSVHGDCAKFIDSDEAQVDQNKENCVSYLKVQFRRLKENGKTGDWFIESFLGGFGTGLKSSTPTDDQNLYRTVGSHGFKTVFENEKQPKSTPYFSEKYQEEFAAELTKVLHNVYNKKDGALEELKKFIVPGGDEILQSFQTFFQELDSKFVSIKPTTNSPQHDGLLARLQVEANDIENGYVMLYTNVERKSATSEKGLSKMYKDAGMSKEVLNTRDGHYSKFENIKFEIVLIEDEIKIASKLESKNTIPF